MTQTYDSNSEYDMEVDSDSEYDRKVDDAFKYLFGDSNISGAYDELSRQVAKEQKMVANTAKNLGYQLEKWQSRGPGSRREERREKRNSEEFWNVSAYMKGTLEISLRK